MASQSGTSNLAALPGMTVRMNHQIREIAVRVGNALLQILKKYVKKERRAERRIINLYRFTRQFRVTDFPLRVA